MSIYDLSLNKRLLIFLGWGIIVLWVGFDTDREPTDAGKCLVCNLNWTWDYELEHISCTECGWHMHKDTYMVEHICPTCGKEGQYESHYVNCYTCGHHLPAIGYSDSYQLVFFFVILGMMVLIKKELCQGHW